ncbi:MAG: 50S ribosomal protein L32 [Oscillospiraceae bacterium]|nr:50S ribosomal protein L32 [Oscillospiraceae bacterium]
MAVPKSKVSKQRRNKRRSSHWKLATPHLLVCTRCGEYRLAHRMCSSCGLYNGRTVIEMENGITAVRKARSESTGTDDE